MVELKSCSHWLDKIVLTIFQVAMVYTILTLSTHIPARSTLVPGENEGSIDLAKIYLSLRTDLFCVRCSWNTALSSQRGVHMGSEFRTKGVNGIYIAPISLRTKESSF
jgi:hypothetical protein